LRLRNEEVHPIATVSAWQRGISLMLIKENLMLRIISILVAIMLCLRGLATEADKKELTVGIEYELWRFAKTDSKPEKFEYVFFVILTNATDQEITVPTSSYDGEPCCWESGMYDKGVTYKIGDRRVGRFWLVDTPARYFPIKLQPGQSAQFAKYKLSSDVQLKVFSAGVEVEEKIAESQKWWTGSIRGTADLTTQKPLQ
jgi:hypothetical protein